MATVQCENKKHYYDDSKHTHCPYCPIPGLKDAAVPATEAASPSRMASPPAQPSPPSQSPGAQIHSGPAPMTVPAVWARKRLNPVTGWLVCIDDVNKGRDYRLHSDRNNVGRAPNMDVCIEGDETISREDLCQVVFDPRTRVFSIVPGTGRNLVYLNGSAVLSAVALKPYDRIELGKGSFIFVPFCCDKFEWEDSKQS